MALVFYAIDNEFATSTGSNIGAYSNSSIFDYPPQGSKDLVITATSGSGDPRLFDIGDTYDVRWGGHSGGGTILNAVVVRSDAAPGEDGGIIVLSGTDENGDPAEIIWTPDFDLEGWYWDNFTPSNQPGFYTQDMQPSYTHSFVCFASETRIETPGGSKQCGQLRAGNLVMTRDGGALPIRWAGQRLGPGTGNAAPVVFDTGSIGNTHPIRLSQEHRVLLRSARAQLLFGFDEVIVPAKACVNGHDICIIPCPRIAFVHLLLSDHHILFAEGAECESLFLGDIALNVIETDRNFIALQSHPDTTIKHDTTIRPVLTINETRALISTGVRHLPPAQYNIAI
ncbi:MAG: Hint domain-containing protein [Rhodobacteraceae bacterium]|nr:Hint domain-containing protein [Paracoccaceae bacterium]